MDRPMPWNEFKTNIRHLSAREQGRVHDAFELGRKMHEGQKRKSGEPYYNHPIAVAHMLADMGADSDTVIAALLHDTVEDTPLTLQEIETLFGANVARLVEGVTKLSRADIGEQPNLDEQIETLRKIFTLMENDTRIMVIKIVDRLHNMQTVEFLPPEKQQTLARETMEVYVKIADRLCMQDLRDELESLCIHVLDPQLFARLSELRKQNEQQGHRTLKEIRQRLEAHFPEHADDVRTEYEHKSWENLREQLMAEGSAVTGVSGITISFVCNTVGLCYQVMGILHQMWQRELMSFQDYINAPAINGYRGLHTTIILEDGTRIRCKMRTPDMHEYAHTGVMSVCFREDMRGTHDSLPWTQRISPLSRDVPGRSKDFWESLQSDILGDSITIHGPADQTVLIPKGSTALDGAFFLFGDDALRLVSVSIGGGTVPLDTPLDHAVSLNAVLGPETGVERSWLDKAHTGFAVASIRSALASGKTDDEKAALGKDLLQRVLREQRKGFLEEFDERMMRERVKQFGYGSLEKVFIAIAEGRLNATAAFEMLFTSKKLTDKARPRVIKYSADLSNTLLMKKLEEVHRQYAGQFQEVRYVRHGPTSHDVILKTVASGTEISALMQQLLATGARNVRSASGMWHYSLGITVLLLLWGLDSVFAKMLLQAGFDAPSLTFVRSWSGFAFAGLMMLVMHKSWKSLSPLPLRRYSLWASGLSFFALNLFTHLALNYDSPFLYKTALRGSSLLLGIPLLLAARKYLKLTGAMLLALLAFVLLYKPVDSFSLLLAVATAGVFAAYTFSSAYFQRTAHVDTRYPQFFFVISAISAFASLCLPLWSPVTIPSQQLLLLAVGFTLVFVCVPYILFYILSRVVDYVSLAPYFHASLVVTFAAQWLLMGINDIAIIPSMLLLTAGSLLASQQWSRNG